MSRELRVGVRTLGLTGPGLPDWPQGAAALAGGAAYTRAPTIVPAPALLSAAERRRASRALRIAIAVAHEAAGAAAAGLATVFSSSGGDGDNCHQLCSVLATSAREVSPTRFMNSVHNAAAGYWSLAAHSMRPATALCAHDGSFCAGLLEAATQVQDSGEPVLLVAHDCDYPQPLRAVRPIPDAFAAALLLTPAHAPGGVATLALRLTQAGPTRMLPQELETLRGEIPAARSLPLLALLARATAGVCVLDYLDELRVEVRVAPC